MKTMNFWLLAVLAVLVGTNVATGEESVVDPDMEESAEEYVPADDTDVETDTSVGSITTFHLWNADTNTELMEIKEGDEFCPRVNGFSIEAKTTGFVRSVYMTLRGPQNILNIARTENVVPWFLAGNIGYTDIAPVQKDSQNYKLKNGYYLLSAQPFKKQGKQGTSGTKKTIRFKINCPVLCRRF